MPSTLRIGSRGPEVSRLQTLLNQAVRPSPRLATDGVFGTLTLTAVRSFQSSQRLTVDGIVGPLTWAALERVTGGQPPPPPPPGGNPPGVVERATQIAISQDGVREQPLNSNRGPQVDQYLRTAAVAPGNPWCMAFVYWSYVQAATQLRVANPMPQTAYCPFLYNWARQHGKLATTPRRGDIFLVWSAAQGRHIHTGIVTAVNGNTVTTIEGNTNTDGSANGIGVFTRRRGVAGLAFVRL